MKVQKNLSKVLGRTDSGVLYIKKKHTLFYLWLYAREIMLLSIRGKAANKYEKKYARSLKKKDFSRAKCFERYVQIMKTIANIKID